MNYAEAIRDLEKRGIMPESAPDLTRTRQGLSQIGFFDWPDAKKLLSAKDRVIVVAGTNGKGSTCAALESLLRHAGERTGFYSSPHLVSYCERIKINGDPISEDLFTSAYTFVAKKTSELKLTHFEVLTLMAVWIFSSGQPNPAVGRMILEVGLGGLWDATNAIPHKMSVITTIDYDHQNLLGHSLKEIAKNKFGIIESESTVIHHPFPAEISDLVSEQKKISGGKWIESKIYEGHSEKGHPPKFFIKTPWGTSGLNMAGVRGIENASLALTVFEELGFEPKNHLKALEDIRWPGRMQLLGETQNGTPVYVSGDHNPQGIRSLIELLPQYPRRNLYLIVGIGKDKDRDHILEPLFGISNCSILLTQTAFKPLDKEGYGPWLNRASGYFENSSEAFEIAVGRAEKEDMILVTGSLYLVGKILTFWLRGDEIERR